ncbi:hypothetical protein MC378_06620 [Polaribacter sp. MSW13]|uniref:Uncharacterized protein n=2 Tax=Polaribacter marinus TaxID=2916838 RepID=A0A9X2AIT1_9FLAO|nr:hypothetical protein [Polaribacter marinus]
MVKELHKRGFGKLRVIPSISPSGLAWRCVLINQTKKYKFIASTWIQTIENIDSRGEIKLSPKELAGLFIKKNVEFIEHCKGKNEEYEKWFNQVVKSLKNDELPYAFDLSDFFFPTSYWLTTKGNEIRTLPNEKDYY